MAQRNRDKGDAAFASMVVADVAGGDIIGGGMRTLTSNRTPANYSNLGAATATTGVVTHK